MRGPQRYQSGLRPHQTLPPALCPKAAVRFEYEFISGCFSYQSISTQLFEQDADRAAEMETTARG